MHKAISAPIIFCLLALVCFGCKDKQSPVPYPVVKSAVYIVCEGQLGVGNAALTRYDPDSGTVVRDAYNAATSGGHLGDVFQSMASYNGSYFFCVNNSDRVIVTSAYNLADNIATLSIPKPRYTLQAQAFKMYVSTLFSNKVYVVGLEGLGILKTITMPRANPEGMLLAGNTAYVCTWDTASSEVYKVDVEKDSIVGSVAIPGRAPEEIVQDAEGMLWVLSGNKAQGVEAKLTKLNPATGAVLQSFAFGSADPIRLITNPAKDSLYFIEVSYTGDNSNNGIYRMGIHDVALPSQAFIPAHGLQYFWGIGISPRNGYIYVADPKGFTISGQVSIYKPNGDPVSSFATGVGPGHFYFE